MNNTDFRSYKILAALSLVCILFSITSVGILEVFYSALFHSFLLPVSAKIFMITGLLLGCAFNILMFKKFTIGFLFAVFFTLIAGRIAALYNLYLISAPVVVFIVIMIIHYWYNVYINLNHTDRKSILLKISDYQIIFLRMYVGFDLIPHFTEKLLAGPVPRLADINAFIHLNISYAVYFVILAGLCELFGALSISTGFLTRLGSALTGLYLLIATLMGKHFTLGFIWAIPGGGWEYPLMWIVFVLTFAIGGARQFSVDALLNQRSKLPKIIKLLMGQ